MFYKKNIKKNTNRNKNKGSMMTEIIIVASVISISVLAAMNVTQRAIVLSHRALHTAQASFLLEEGAENVRIARDNAWNNIVSLNSSEQIDIFTRTTVASNVNRDAITGDVGSGVDDPGTKLITVTVSWNQNGSTVSKVLNFYINNIFS